ncbi:hypothetical protein DY000_02062702 [Brassica cretica]|uniref:Homeobox domain-containing protein n=1 Tax=Brassica cretica TaxID=69181 RepID=A0ABQ7B3G4_BRACR|nr:hypothetical protein DY000_02062702 [Brassica cretica]
MVRDLDINQTPKTEEDRGWIMIGTTPHINEEDENLGGRPRKKLRLTKEQSHLLEESFIQNHTLTPKQKQELAILLKLSQRQVEVWFQNRRARYVLRSTAFVYCIVCLYKSCGIYNFISYKIVLLHIYIYGDACFFFVEIR